MFSPGTTAAGVNRRGQPRLWEDTGNGEMAEMTKWPKWRNGGRQGKMTAEIVTRE